LLTDKIYLVPLGLIIVNVTNYLPIFNPQGGLSHIGRNKKQPIVSASPVGTGYIKILRVLKLFLPVSIINKSCRQWKALCYNY